MPLEFWLIGDQVLTTYPHYKNTLALFLSASVLSLYCNVYFILLQWKTQVNSSRKTANTCDFFLLSLLWFSVVFASVSRRCIYNPDCLCYICGKLIFKKQKGNFSVSFSVGYQDKPWAPDICCITCITI